MKKTLYELTTDYALLYDLMAAGEELTEQQAEELMSASGDLMEKMDAYGIVMQGLNARIAELKAEEERLARWRKTVESHVTRLKGGIENTMNALGLDKTETKHWRYSFRTSKAVEVGDDFVAYAQKHDRHDLIRTTVAPNRVAIRKALENGEELPAHITERRNLQVR